MPADITAILDRYGADRTRLLDMLWAVQDADGHITQPAIEGLAAGLSLSRAEIEETVSFYHFFSMQPAGRHRIYLNNDVSTQLSGRYEAVRDAFEEACGCTFGTVSADGRFGLYDTACIGMCDREPAALIDFVPFTDLTPERVAKIVASLKDGVATKSLAAAFDSGCDVVTTRWQRTGPVFDPRTAAGPSLEALFSLAPGEILEAVAASGLRGRGGAGFSTGLKWRLCRETKAATRYVVCNADEGEPGTFKDRALLTDMPHLLIEGMVAAAYAIDASAGVIYLRAEYRYLFDRLDSLIADYRKAGWLGHNIAGSGFDFDLRLQLGAGSYVCGEESALIESMEGKRGSPRNRPPFPVEAGFCGMPTIVNNVETLAAVPRILKEGADWYAGFGTEKSPGTKLLSVAGDCARPGIYEVPFGITVGEFLDMVGAEPALALQVSGPSGECINAAQSRHRRLCHEDLSIGGAMTVFSAERDLLDHMSRFLSFFIAESCGICTPCRSGNVAMKTLLERLRDGRGEQRHLADLERWGHIIAETSRCGLGASAPNPVLSSLREFPDLYAALVDGREAEMFVPGFDLDASTGDYRRIVERARSNGR